MDISPYLADVVAIAILCLAVYYPRHRRRDLLVAYVGVNIGVLAVSTALISSDATIGLGLGLFGVLSIIRLRSAELGQHEVAYYFGALALGLLGGLGSTSLPVTLGLMASIVVALAVADSRHLFGRDRQQLVRLDGAVTDEATLITELESLLGGRVHRVVVQKVDVVDDTTLVDVRWSNAPAAEATRPDPSAAPLTLAETSRR